MLFFIACSVDTLIGAKVVSVRGIRDGLAFVGDGAHAIVTGEENGNDIKGKAVEGHVIFEYLNINGCIDGSVDFVVVGINGLCEYKV